MGARVSFTDVPTCTSLSLFFGPDMYPRRHAVRSFGTEGRVEGSVIPPSQVLHDFVCFRGQDIMDLHVHDAETDEVRTRAYPPKIRGAVPAALVVRPLVLLLEKNR